MTVRLEARRRPRAPSDALPEHQATAIAEEQRLRDGYARLANWQRWGPYLSERQWGTVREDYSEDGESWTYFPHDHARSRAYRWGEDGLLGICDRECRLCFAVALWNGRDPILKERLFGLTGPEGNHGEDVKECYYYLDSTPTHSYMKALYKYPQAEFPYARLVEENRRRGRHELEFELSDTGVFRENRYFDVFVEYAKNSPNDILIRITIANRGPETARVHVLPTLWFRNAWSWGCTHEGCEVKPRLALEDGAVVANHATLGTFHFVADAAGVGAEAGSFRHEETPTWLFTDNETNTQRLYDFPNVSPWVKDAFHEHVIHGNAAARDVRSDRLQPVKGPAEAGHYEPAVKGPAEAGHYEPAVKGPAEAGHYEPTRQFGTKTAAYYRLEIPPGGEAVLRLRLSAQDEAPVEPFGTDFDVVFTQRIREADEFYAARIPRHDELSAEHCRVARQAYAGLLWSKQFYHYVVQHWIEGDPDQPTPPPSRKHGRNHDWPHLFNRDVISMPDKWEYPWYAAWDLAFHMIPMAYVDGEFAKGQLELFLREWYMHPNGQIPAYEFAFSDVNPPVHAWACWRVYKITGPRGGRDRRFLSSVFKKLLLNFTWWVNRKDAEGNHLFSGGFLGLDNIGVFDRSKPLPGGGRLEQADGTAWMAFYCATMLSMSLELAQEDPTYEDIASKFFEHFVHIADAMNTLGGTGLWDDEDGFFYDQLRTDHHVQPLQVRSIVGIIPLFAVEVLEQDAIDRLPGFKKRMEWFLKHRPELARHITYCAHSTETEPRDFGKSLGSPSPGYHHHRLLAIPSRERLLRVLRYLLDENEFLSPHGIRALSRHHKDRPYVLHSDGQEHRVQYDPAESTSGLFGGNSNWRGPVWFPVNFLIVEALERYHHFYGDELQVECPTGSGRMLTLEQAAREIGWRLCGLFLPGETGRRPCQGGDQRYADDPHWRELLLFHEYFHGDNGRGMGASHQTGWTALVAPLLRDAGGVEELRVES